MVCSTVADDIIEPAASGELSLPPETINSNDFRNNHKLAYLGEFSRDCELIFIIDALQE